MDSLYDHVSEAAVAAIKEELHLHQREMHNAFYLWALRLRHEHRIYFSNTDVVRNVLWPELRDNEALLDLILRATTGFYTRLVSVDGQNLYKLYCETLADGLGDLTRVENNNLAITDTTFNEKLPNRKEIATLMEREKWLCLVITIERCLTKLVPAKMLEPLDAPVVKTERN